MIRFLRYVSLLLVTVSLFACASGKSTSKAELPEIITTGTKTQKFNLQLDFGKNHFSGLLIARKMENGEIRLLFTTHFGLSVFDFSLHKDSMAVNNIVEPMRKKKVLNLLEKDFRLTFLPSCNMRIKEKSTIFEKRTTGWGLPKAVITLSEFNESEPNRVLIKHPWIKLKIQLDKLSI
ncbi:hypothetical protein [Bacteroides sp. 519]|uniref:hypothetical protein n=1 Tax=Bacteroides sp. 519 TaxID=2302937 RepID=UPI0013D1E262|nr:hypothetical protein [Bacteroides sp. 519]NDV60701.1 hypothetical protein [Bacteroides sp. 519]